MSGERVIPPPVAEVRTYGDLDNPDMWAARCDRLESFLLDASHPRRNMRTGCHGFDVQAAHALAATLRQAFADGSLTTDDLAAPDEPSPFVHEHEALS